MKRRWHNLEAWLDNRTGIHSAVRRFLYEEIPAPSGWHQVFGSVAVFLFLTQAFTGVLLAFNHAPTPGDAYNSLRYIPTELTGGRLIRGLHHWGASTLIVVVVLHMVQVFLYGANKKPRETTWMVGVVLLLSTLAYGLTGYLLPWDNRAYWGTVVATQIAGQAPLLGPYLSRLLGGQGAVGVVTFARFYGLHVLLLPPATLLLIALHVFLVRQHGVAPAAVGWTGLTAAAVLSTPRQPPEVAVDYSAPTDWLQLSPEEMAGVAYFRQEHCVNCHAIGGSGASIGPDPTRTPIRRDAAWMIRHFKHPADMRPGTSMPAIQLSDAQLNSLAAFLLKLNADNATALESAPEFATAGALVFQAGHCGSCHMVNGAGMEIGPPLNGLAKRQTRSWVEQHFANPEKLSPGSIMPPYRFPKKDMENLTSYLFALPD
jgi:ubiquinol-cytochrome c reductase cytochrome b subunit